MSEIVAATRAQARKPSHTKELGVALAILAAPVLAYQSLRLSKPEPAPASIAAAARPPRPAPEPARAAPQQPMAERIARGGIDFTATSATCATAGATTETSASPCAPARRKTPTAKGKLRAAPLR